MNIDSTVPVHQQPTMAVRQPGDCWRHHWYSYANGVECPKCDALLLRTTGQRRYKGRHRVAA